MSEETTKENTIPLPDGYFFNQDEKTEKFFYYGKGTKGGPYNSVNEVVIAAWSDFRAYRAIRCSYHSEIEGDCNAMRRFGDKCARHRVVVVKAQHDPYLAVYKALIKKIPRFLVHSKKTDCVKVVVWRPFLWRKYVNEWLSDVQMLCPEDKVEITYTWKLPPYFFDNE